MSDTQKDFRDRYKLRWLVDLPRNFYRSVFRLGRIPLDELDQSEAVFNNLFLHIIAVRIKKRNIKLSYTLGLGLISFYLFIILVVTGIFLMFYYVPSTTQAHQRMLDLRSSVAFGTLFRNLHRWSAHAMVALVFLHMCRVFYTGSYKPPREFNWVIGVFLFVITMFLSFTGYLLPWDQLAFWAITVGANIAGYAPVLGPKIRYILLGGDTVGQEALLRFYVLHVMVLPLTAVILISLHFWRIRKDGGLALPEDYPYHKSIKLGEGDKGGGV
jgi:quinol-cytochrome oxidoreductase complex cytochrome b subunit